MERQSSFARSFFKEEKDEEEDHGNNGGAAADSNSNPNPDTGAVPAATNSKPAYPMPKSRPSTLVKRRSSRLLSTGKTRQSLDNAQKAQREIAQKLAGMNLENDFEHDLEEDDDNNSFRGANSFLGDSSSFAAGIKDDDDNHDKDDDDHRPNHHHHPSSLHNREATEPYENSFAILQESASSMVPAMATTENANHPSTSTTTTTTTITTHEDTHPKRDGRPVPEKQNSWYQDALAQGGLGEGSLDNLKDLLGDEAVAAADFGESPMAAAAAASSPLHNHDTHNNGDTDGGTGWDDDEVLEQYRLMAQHEATLRVKANTGFDVQEYEQRKHNQKSQSVETQFQQEAGHGLYYTGQMKLTHHLPLPKRCGNHSSNNSILEPPKPMEPPPPPYQPIPHVRVPPMRRVPDLWTGELVVGEEEEEQVDEQSHVVGCLGCHAPLRVHRYATLVSCPNCHTVSPASSTRRLVVR